MGEMIVERRQISQTQHRRPIPPRVEAAQREVEFDLERAKEQWIELLPFFERAYHERSTKKENTSEEEGEEDQRGNLARQEV